MDDFAFGMMSFMPGDHLDIADVAFWNDPAPAYEERPREAYEVDEYNEDDLMDMEDECKPIEEDWVEDEDETRSSTSVPARRENTLAPSSRNPGYAEEEAENVLSRPACRFSLMPACLLPSPIHKIGTLHPQAHSSAFLLSGPAPSWGFLSMDCSPSTPAFAIFLFFQLNLGLAYTYR